MKTTRLLAAAGALAAAAGITACHPSGSTTGSAPSGTGASMPAAATPTATGTGTATGTSTGQGTAPTGVKGVSTGPGNYIMQAMPAGTVSFQRTAADALQAQLTVTGLTPGSSHDVAADSPSAPPVQFPVLTAGQGGQATAALTLSGGATSLPGGSRIVITLGTPGDGSLAGEPIAETAQLPARPQPGTAFALHPVTATPGGSILGQARGTAQITYNANARTLTVTLTASGLTPGPHAAHIHLGTCQNQGAVKYMLPDFAADGNGTITSQTRVVTGVTSVPGPGAWYLNLHQGSSGQILTPGGTPTLYFRPMLCTDITSFATAGGTAVQPSAPMTASPAGSMPPAPSPTAPATAGTTMAPAAPTMPSGTMSAVPTADVPTHW